MKHRMQMAVCAVLLLNCVTTPFHVNAQQQSTITTEKFTYDKDTRRFDVAPDLLTMQSPYERIVVVTHVLDCADDFDSACMVLGIEGMGKGSDSYAWLKKKDIKVLLETHDLQVGDMIRMDYWGKMMLSPPIFEPYEGSSVSYLCAGEEFFGEEFNTVLRYMSTYPYLDHVGRVDDSLYTYGDVCEDGELDILDVIAVNQYMIGTRTLDKYCEIWADVNKDDTIDSTDALMILKEVLGLTERFQEK